MAYVKQPLEIVTDQNTGLMHIMLEDGTWSIVTHSSEPVRDPGWPNPWPTAPFGNHSSQATTVSINAPTTK